MKYFILLIIGFCFPALAQLDDASQEALEKTQEVLTNPQKRQEAQKNDPKAQAMDKSLDELTNDSQKKQKIYDISAKALSDLVQKAAGDPKVMEQLIEEAQKDPQTFFNNVLPEAQKREVRDLANEIEKTKAPSGPK